MSLPDLYRTRRDTSVVSIPPGSDTGRFTVTEWSLESLEEGERGMGTLAIRAITGTNAHDPSGLSTIAHMETNNTIYGSLTCPGHRISRLMLTQCDALKRIVFLTVRDNVIVMILMD